MGSVKLTEKLEYEFSNPTCIYSSGQFSFSFSNNSTFKTLKETNLKYSFLAFPGSNLPKKHALDKGEGERKAEEAEPMTMGLALSLTFFIVK